MLIQTILFVLTVMLWTLSFVCFKLDKGNYERGDFIGSILGLFFFFVGSITFVLQLFDFLVKVFE